MPRPDGLRWGVPLPHKKWSQDTLPPPEGYGGMGEVDFYNAQIVRREFFVVPLKFTAISWGQSQTMIWPSDQDGDFWIDDIALFIDQKGGANLGTGAPWGRVIIKDLRSGYNWFGASGTRMNIFSNVVISPTSRRDPLIEPYCITRDGGFSVTVTLDPSLNAASPVDLYWSFGGWKEYKNVSK